MFPVLLASMLLFFLNAAVIGGLATSENPQTRKLQRSVV